MVIKEECISLWADVLNIWAKMLLLLFKKHSAYKCIIPPHEFKIAFQISLKQKTHTQQFYNIHDFVYYISDFNHLNILIYLIK